MDYYVFIHILNNVVRNNNKCNNEQRKMKTIEEGELEMEDNL
jgi:hypothetical protein